MDFLSGKYTITKKENLSKNCYSFTILCPDIASIAKASQFAHVLAEGFSLRRPISICAVDGDTIRLVFEVRGDGTAKLAELNSGSLIDIMAPLGNGFTLTDPRKKAIVVGGGIGTPPLLGVAAFYDNPTAIIGFRSASAVILQEDFERLGTTIVCTDDGTYGTKGYVTTALEQHIESADIVYACGPHPMLKGVIEIAQKHNVLCEVSLEERMGCGVGACLVCACRAVKDGNEYFAHVCKDGPVFNGAEVAICLD